MREREGTVTKDDATVYGQQNDMMQVSHNLFVTEWSIAELQTRYPVEAVLDCLWTNGERRKGLKVMHLTYSLNIQ